MRAIDIRNMNSKMIKMITPDVKTPRHYRIVLNKTKNDPNGEGPEEGRTFRVPCHCYENFECKISFLRTVTFALCICFK